MAASVTDELRRLPAISALLTDPRLRSGRDGVDHGRLVGALRAAAAAARERIKQGERAPDAGTLIAQALAQLERERCASLRRVVNATGVVLNTNLGRSPLATAALEALEPVAGHYSNLEFDLASGQRGSRYDHVNDLLCRLSGAEAALVVNNCAAAVLLVVDTFSRGREVVVSRGQLVEIGGSFRVPEVIGASGARLVEVGTTNKTHPHDYQRAITEQTAMLLRCHPSNFRMVGFVEEVESAQLAAIAHQHGLLAVEDLGSGVLVDLSAFGLPKEPTVQQSVASGLDLVTFSGDKLLGGPQAGIVVGRRDLIARLKQNPLLRALRQDKTCLAALEATLRLYLDPAQALREVPTLRMLARPLRELREQAEALALTLRAALGPRVHVATPEGVSPVGGGSLPGAELPTVLVALTPKTLSPQELANRLRAAPEPVVARIEHQRVLLDPRTLLPGDEARLVAALEAALA